MSSATRLLVLGAVRILQPVHGYDVRRELLSWRLGEVANVKPGSIYSALRTLEKDGCIVVHARESEESRPERTTYQLTAEGDKEFQVMLREGWWTVQRAAEPLVPVLCLLPFFPRRELIRALQSRIGQLEANIEATGFTRGGIADGADGSDGAVPEHVREILDFLTSRDRAELEWARGFQKRVREGAYRFVGDPGFPEPGPGQGVTR